MSETGTALIRKWWCPLNDKSNSQKRAEIAQDICNSEAFARLMVGVNTVDQEIETLRDRWAEYVAVNGGYGGARKREDEQ
jgi:hypothetical protein